MLHPERFFDPENKSVAIEIYNAIKDLPLICLHGHVEPGLFSAPNFRWPSPVDLLNIPDHHVFRMLYSQGIALSGQPRITIFWLI
jgi:glucuronate isomerase